MKTMMLTDLAIMRRTLAQLLVICVFVALFISVAVGNLATAASCLAAMVPLMCAFSLLAYDEMNDWQSFRLSLPMKRGDVVAGRYAGILVITVLAMALSIALAYAMAGLAALLGPQSPLQPLALEGNPHEMIWGASVLGACTPLLMAAVTLPLAMRSGMTRSVQTVPLVVALLMIAGVMLFTGDGPLAPAAAEILRVLPEGGPGFVMVAVGACAVTLAIYLLSLLVTLRLYAKREL